MEANRAGPLRFFPDILPPLGRTNIAAPFIILFIYGWTRSFWPLRTTPDAAFHTVVMGIRRMVSSGESLPVWHAATGIAIPGMTPGCGREFLDPGAHAHRAGGAPRAAATPPSCA